MTASSSSLSDHSAEQALDDLRMQHSKLRADLDSERSNVKQLKHEKSHQAKVRLGKIGDCQINYMIIPYDCQMYDTV